MTKNSLVSYLISAAALLFLQFFTYGQGIEASVTINETGRFADIAGRTASGNFDRRNFFFKKSVIGNASLGDRVSDLRLTTDGSPVGMKMLMPGEFLADTDFDAWQYRIDLQPPKDRRAAAHSSWLGSDIGVIYPDDLLPQIYKDGKPVAVKLRLSLPPGWRAVSSGRMSPDGSFEIENTERAVIFIGKNLRNSGGTIDLTIAGEWLFTDAGAAAMAKEIYDEYSKMLGGLKGVRPRVAILKFSSNEIPGAWEAETRGETVTILSSDMPFKAQSLQRLHEQLRHEIFHLWFPNGVRLSGDYAWFYEGFAMYMSLRLGVKLNRIRFDDMLDTLARAYTIDANARPRRTLTDAGADETVGYARGMIVAMLFDLELIAGSRGRSDASHVLRTLFERFGPNGKADVANDVIPASFGFQEIIQNHVFGVKPLELTEKLAGFGIDVEQTGRTATFAVAAKLTGRQREILDRLGYNNWRKLGNKR